MPASDTFIIAGGVLAGAKTAETLREQGFGGRIVLAAEEEFRPTSGLELLGVSYRPGTSRLRVDAMDRRLVGLPPGPELQGDRASRNVRQLAPGSAVASVSTSAA